MYFFFFNDTATTEIYTLSLHDALPIFKASNPGQSDKFGYVVSLSQDGNTLAVSAVWEPSAAKGINGDRSEEHTSELQSQSNLVCRLLLEKKNQALDGFGACEATPTIII